MIEVSGNLASHKKLFQNQKALALRNLTIETHTRTELFSANWLSLSRMISPERLSKSSNSPANQKISQATTLKHCDVYQYRRVMTWFAFDLKMKVKLPLPNHVLNAILFGD